MPGAVLSNVIFINNTPIPLPSLAGQTLSFIMPLTLAAGSLLEILLPEEAGLVNPAYGHYNLEIHSTQNHGPESLPYDILLFIPEAEVIPAPNPSSIGRVRFFFNLDGPARVELLVLNILGDKVSRVVEHYGAAKKGEVLNWNTQNIGPGIYWALVTIHYNDGRVVKIKKKKIVIIK